MWGNLNKLNYIIIELLNHDYSPDGTLIKHFTMNNIGSYM